MRTMLRATLAAVAVLPLVAGSALAQDYSGVYVGTYTASQAPGEHKISLTFKQSGTSIQGAYITSTGVAGICFGVLSSNVAQMYCQNTTPSCPGTYKGPYTFSTSNVTWTYTGQDCLGDEQGKGAAQKLAAF